MRTGIHVYGFGTLPTAVVTTVVTALVAGDTVVVTCSAAPAAAVVAVSTMVGLLGETVSGPGFEPAGGVADPLSPAGAGAELATPVVAGFSAAGVAASPALSVGRKPG